MKDKKKLLIGIIAAAVILIVVGIILLFTNNKEDKKDKQEATYEEETKVVGRDEYGYITIPGDWILFEDQASPVYNGYQYSDSKGEYIITVSKLTTSSSEYTTILKTHLASQNMSDINEEDIKFDGHDAHKITAKSDEMTVLTIYFEDNGTLYFIGMEGPEMNEEYFKIPDTYRMKK